MVLGIGCDIIEIARIKKASEKRSFINKCYTENEIALIDKKGPATTAGNFCVKEAVVKALGTGFFPIMPRDIEVLRDSFGKPYVNLHSEAEVAANRLGVKNVLVSISHSKDYAMAYVILT